MPGAARARSAKVETGFAESNLEHFPAKWIPFAAENATKQRDRALS
jgi:hypothetical protein